MSPLLEARKIKKTYRIDAVETPVLKGIDLEIPRKGLLAIMGASGAGKSTLMHVLSSMDTPDEGEVLFEGESLYQRSDEALSQFRNEAMGFIFQFHHLLPEFTALENVMMPLLIRRARSSEARKKALQRLEELGLGNRAHHRPSELSGGEQQRVAVARALVGSPRIVFADEPTGNLDQENSEHLIDLLMTLHREQELTLVLVTHNTAIAGRFPQKVRLANGHLETLTL